jgi:putative ABC transport system permease protein
MTPVFEGVGIAVDSLRSNKSRAALTILGVAIGVMVVMIMASMISGINKSVSDTFNQIAPKTFIVQRFFQGGINISDGSDEMSPWRRNPSPSEEEARRIAGLSGVHFVTVRESAGNQAAYGDKKLPSVGIIGMGAHWIEVNGGDIYPGRNFTTMEDAALSRVVVISPKFRDQLFGGLDPIGRTVKIAGVPYEVVGIYNQPPSLFGGASPPIAVVPHSTFAKYVPHWRGWLQIAVSPSESATQQEAMDQVTAMLRSMRNLKPAQENNFAIVTADKILDTWNQVTSGFFAVMLALSSIGLMVGGVGVVAIMMISVTERTREIGVRKALGATRREILWQFLVEAATVTMIGGAIGMLVGGLIAWIVSHTTSIPAYVPFWSIVAALAGSALTGVGFGMYPAAKAAKLDPIEALRYE